MSDGVVRGDEVTTGNGKTLVGMPYQSVWMAHWATASTSNNLSLGGSSRFTEANQLKTIDFMSETAGLGGESRSNNLGNCGGVNHSGMLKSKVGGGGDLLPQFLALAPCGMETRSRESRLQVGSMGMSNELEGLRDRFGERYSLVSLPFEENVVGSTSKITPFGYIAKPPFQPLLAGQVDIDQPTASAPFWVHEKRSNRSSELSLHDPSTSNIQLRDSAAGGSQKMPSHSGMKLFSSNLPRGSNLEKLSGDGYCVMPIMPSSLHDVETMRVHTTIDTVEEFSLGPPKYSQTTRQLLITKKTDVNSSDGGQMFRESTLSTEFEGKAVREFCNLSPAFSFQGRQGLTLKPLDSSTESEEKEIIDAVKNYTANLKNELSAETDTMDMDGFQENNLSGVVSSHSNKKLPTSQALMPAVREESLGRMLATGLPDINQEFPTIPGVAGAADDNEASISGTQSLDVEHIISHAKDPLNLQSGADQGGPVGVDPCSRWIKRLKPSSDSLAYGTKGSTVVEVSPQRKVSKFFDRMLKCSKSSSEQKSIKSHDGEVVVVDQTAVLQKNSKSLSSSSAMKSEDITLSHAWIQRWCRNADVFPQKKHEVTLLSEAHSSKAATDNFQEKQFPSIAAIALMGRTMNGLRPCEVRKKGAMLIWNTEGD